MVSILARQTKKALLIPFLDPEEGPKTGSGSKIGPCPSPIFSMLSSHDICCQIVSWTMPENTRMAFQPETENAQFAEGDNRFDATQLSNRERHTILWNSIFCDYKWIEEIVRDFFATPFLIGTRLDALHLGNKDDSKPLYAALISGDISGDVTYTKDLFFSCLKPHKLVEGTDEILFDSGIILNISDILNCPELIPVDIKQLLYDGDKLSSTYSFWRDVDGAPRRLEPASLTLTKSRIPGDEEHFGILKLKSDDGPSHPLSVNLKSFHS